MRMRLVNAEDNKYTQVDDEWKQRYPPMNSSWPRFTNSFTYQTIMDGSFTKVTYGVGYRQDFGLSTGTVSWDFGAAKEDSENDI